MYFPPLGESGVGKTATIKQMLEKLEGPEAFAVKYGSILGEVLLHNEIKKSRLYILNSKFYLSDKNAFINICGHGFLKKVNCYIKCRNFQTRR
jgi:Cdc6-like AAA superfamily ATPase